MSVRTATLADVDAIGALGDDFAAEAATGLPYDRHTIEATAAACIASHDRCALVWDARGVDGVILGAAGASLVHPAREAAEVLFYVRPAARGRAGPALLIAFLAWAEAQGAAVVVLQALAGTRAGALYRRNGFRTAAQVWVR